MIDQHEILTPARSYPCQKFCHYRDRIVHVSCSAVNLGESVMAGRDRIVEPHHLMRVALDTQTVTAYGKPEPLRLGMVLEADILDEHRKLYEWLLEPLYSLRGTVGTY